MTEDRVWRGGVIAPGFPLMRDYLFERTAKLPRMELGKGKPPRIGRSTEEAMRFGALVGYRGMVREIVRSDSMKTALHPSSCTSMKFAVKEKAWKSGRTKKTESFSFRFALNVFIAPRMSAMKFECVSIAPFGLPVVPDV